MKRCETCSHWKKFDTSYADYGECKESSPTIDTLLLMFRGGVAGDWSPVAQNQNTFWPVTHKEQECDMWTD